MLNADKWLILKAHFSQQTKHHGLIFCESLNSLKQLGPDLVTEDHGFYFFVV